VKHLFIKNNANIYQIKNVLKHIKTQCQIPSSTSHLKQLGLKNANDTSSKTRMQNRLQYDRFIYLSTRQSNDMDVI